MTFNEYTGTSMQKQLGIERVVFICICVYMCMWFICVYVCMYQSIYISL